jgi:transposase
MSRSRLERQDNRAHRGREGGRPPAFDPRACKRRNVVGRCFQCLKQYRAIATRYDKTALAYQGMIDLSALLIWL